MEDPTHLSLCFSWPPLESNSVIGRGRMEGRKEGRKEDREGQTGSEGEKKKDRRRKHSIRTGQFQEDVNCVKLAY